LVLQSEAVQRLFLNKLIDVALTWHQNFPTLPPTSSRFLHCSIHAIKNMRRKMEDKHVALAEFNQLFGIQDGVERAYYAVFDGHGGVDAATYAATHLHVALSKQETLQSDTATAFKSAFKHTDDMFKSKAKRERLRSGTTGVIVLIQDHELTVAWLGDSQAILLLGDEDYVLLACDGFFDAVKPSEVPHLVLDALQQPSDPESRVDAPLEQSGHTVGLKIAQQLVGYAKAVGSSDNITVILVFLRPPEQLLAHVSTTGTTQVTQDSASQDSP
ncbi:Protein phosphatase 1F, partial [Nibea albiflora]